MNDLLCHKVKLVSLGLIFVCELGWNNNAWAISLGRGFDLDVNISALSDYRDTGISQTRGDPALQTDLILQHDSGLYVGAFASNVDFGTQARLETMYYIGSSIPIGEQVYFDVSLGRYEYPKEAYADYNELYAELGAYGFQLGYTYSFDNRGHVPNNSNVFLAYNFELPYESALQVRYGYSDVRTDAFWSSEEKARRSFYDWEVKISKDVYGVNVFASYIDTDLSKNECFSATGFDDVCSATLVVGVSKKL